jgi:hypothetical protein
MQKSKYTPKRKKRRSNCNPFNLHSEIFLRKKHLADYYHRGESGRFERRYAIYKNVESLPY